MRERERMIPFYCLFLLENMRKLFNISKIRIVADRRERESLSTMNKVTFVTMRLATYFGKLENLIKLN